MTANGWNCPVGDICSISGGCHQNKTTGPVYADVAVKFDHCEFILPGKAYIINDTDTTGMCYARILETSGD